MGEVLNATVKNNTENKQLVVTKDLSRTHLLWEHRHWWLGWCVALHRCVYETGVAPRKSNFVSKIVFSSIILNVYLEQITWCIFLSDIVILV